jgi:hypothetical protein
MSHAVTKSALSPARRRLIELMQEINYGRIESLEVRDGEPVFDPPPAVVRLFLFGKDSGPNASRGNDGFALKKKVAELLKVFDRQRLLSIQELVIDNGLPVRMTIKETTGM